MADITMKGVCKKYSDGVTAVSGFDLDIKDKEFIVLVGPTGCGKSTVLRMIAGLEEVSTGELYIDGKLCNDVESKNRDIAVVFQDYALYPHMTVAENMAFGLKLHRIPRDEIIRRVDEAAKLLNITHLLDRRPKALSGGQRQRVAIGRAIVRNPKVFLMDEPISNLDAKLRAQMRTELSKLHQRLEKTFIYVTHDQTEAMAMGTRIVVMKAGHIQQIGAPRVLYESPLNLFVATFIGSPQMNTIEGTLLDEGGVTYFKFGGAMIALPEGKGRTPEVLAYAGRDVIMGIRPEYVCCEEADLSRMRDSLVDASVEVVEMMGAETYLYLMCEGRQITARVSPRSVANSREEVKIEFDPEGIHIFDRKTEKVII